MSQVAELARKCLADFAGDRVKAAQVMEAHVHKDKALFVELLSPLVHEAVWSLLSRVAHEGRRAIWQEARVDSGAGARGGLAQLASARAQSFLRDFYISSGKALGEASREEVKTEQALHRGLATANGVKAKFYARIANAWKPGAKRVKDWATEGQLRTFSRSK